MVGVLGVFFLLFHMAFVVFLVSDVWSIGLVLFGLDEFRANVRWNVVIVIFVLEASVVVGVHVCSVDLLYLYFPVWSYVFGLFGGHVYSGQCIVKVVSTWSCFGSWIRCLLFPETWLVLMVRGFAVRIGTTVWLSLPWAVFEHALMAVSQYVLPFDLSKSLENGACVPWGGFGGGKVYIDVWCV